MAPVATPDRITPGVEDVVADAKLHAGTGSGEHSMVLNMGPQHPSTHGVLRVVIELDGEIVVALAPDIGYLHTGIEKTCEAKFYQQVVPLTDRIDYLCPMTNNLAYCLAVEKLLGLEIPERAQLIRVLLNEITRIQSHLVWLGTHAMDIGALTMFLYCWREREATLRIFEAVSGQRMMTSYFRIGGLALEPPKGFFESIQEFLDAMPVHIDQYEGLLTGNPIWFGRLKGVGYLSAADAIALGVTGPPLRASGVDWDLRRDLPYSGYEKFKFDVPVSNDGDVWARYTVRMLEMRESVKICYQRGNAGGPASRSGRKARADCGRRSQDRSAQPRENEDRDGSAHPSLQDRDRRLRGARWRGLPGGREPARRDGILRRLRWHRQALSRPHAQPFVRHATGPGDHVQGTADRGCGCGDWQHRYCAGGDRPITHSARKGGSYESRRNTDSLVPRSVKT